MDSAPGTSWITHNYALPTPLFLFTNMWNTRTICATSIPISSHYISCRNHSNTSVWLVRITPGILLEPWPWYGVTMGALRQWVWVMHFKSRSSPLFLQYALAYLLACLPPPPFTLTLKPAYLLTLKSACYLYLYRFNPLPLNPLTFLILKPAYPLILKSPCSYVFYFDSNTGYK